MNYPEALEFLNSCVDHERERDFAYPEGFKLDRMRALSREMKNPQNSFESVIVSGSKGKGSTCAFLSSILRMDNTRTGLFTSPHLVDVSERIQVNGLPISQPRFVQGVEILRGFLDSQAWRRDPPTYFELLTALAFWHFREMKVEVAVLEVGLGGLYDSTNIAPAKVVGITPISLEHTDHLGKTIAKIATQKAGIIKGRETVVSGIQTAEAEEVIRRVAFERDAEVFRVRKEIRPFEREYGEDFQRFDLRSPLGNYFDLSTGMLGRHQIENAAQAVGLAKALESKTRLRVSDSAVRQGICDARWPARLEKIGSNPVTILDGAHNPESVRVALAGVKRHFHYRRLLVVLGVSADKDVAGILEPLAAEAFAIVFTQSLQARALPAADLAAHIEGFACEKSVEPDLWKAIEKARAAAGENDLVFIVGSLFLAGELKARMGRGGML